MERSAFIQIVAWMETSPHGLQNLEPLNHLYSGRCPQHSHVGVTEEGRVGKSAGIPGIWGALAVLTKAALALWMELNFVSTNKFGAWPTVTPGAHNEVTTLALPQGRTMALTHRDTQTPAVNSAWNGSCVHSPTQKPSLRTQSSSSNSNYLFTITPDIKRCRMRCQRSSFAFCLQYQYI